MTDDPADVQNLDANYLTFDKSDESEERTRIAEDTWNFKFKGLGLNLQFGRQLKSWLKSER